EDSGIFDAIMSLPAKYKIVMDLHYIEGYTASEISEITGINADAVRKRMQTGRNKLRKIMESDFND
ncbi:MAG: RNA polymerase sigma factor, partial [Clostridia bacterium]|nr:RNA polymerase sigma factor [Clostridia bacterium]